MEGKEKENKDLDYYKRNCQEELIETPISVIRYISELEEKLKTLQNEK